MGLPACRIGFVFSDGHHFVSTRKTGVPTGCLFDRHWLDHRGAGGPIVGLHRNARCGGAGWLVVCVVVALSLEMEEVVTI